ncbi:MAG TPA: YciI family protein [Allosphingosinicella sp.]|nr:YciI family protein [Allosphingosinicella sp.]
MKWLLPLAIALVQAPVAPEPAPVHRLFLFLYRPGPAWQAGVPMARQNLRDHAAYHARLVREGRSFAAGGYTGEDGGMAIVRAADIEEARAMLAADPAIRNGAFVAEIRQWTPRFYGDAPLAERPR